jgi:hypothetical protein
MPHNFKDFYTLFSAAATTSHEFLITGDFNLHVDDLFNSNTKQFLSTLSAANLSQHVHLPTHTHQQTLDLITTHSNSTHLMSLLLLSLLLITIHMKSLLFGGTEGLKQATLKTQQQQIL